jgi:peptidoglycan/LPS O-acetylase OafA/YrhL
VGNASVAVDTFFLISGLLVAYQVLKDLHKNKGQLRPNPPTYFGMYYLVRYIRLTPSYGIGIGLVATLLRYFGSGPLWGTVIDNSDLCKKDWWKYVLYIHNYERPDVDYEGQITCFPQVS